MALTFNGTSSGLARTGSIVTAYPFTIFAWTKASTLKVAFVAELAVDPGPRGTHEGHGALVDGSSMRAYSTIGSSVSAYSSRAETVGDWVPCMVVYASDGLRKVYYGNGAVQVESTSIPQVPSLLTTFSVGKRAVLNTLYWAGDLASVGLWSTELSAADFATLAAGTVPSTVRSGSLIDYWSLLTQAATQTGANGRVLTASATAQAANHPIAESNSDTTAPTLTGAITVSNLGGTSYTLAWPAGTDNVAVSSYERSLDGGSSWVDVGNVLTVNITGRTAGTTDQVRVRAKDAAGNASSPALAAAVNLPDTSAPILVGALTVSNLTGSSYTISWPAGTDNVAVTSYEYSLDGGSTWLGVGNVLTANIAGRTPGTTDQVRVRAKDAVGNSSLPALGAAVSLPDTIAPALSGSIIVSNLTSTGYTFGWPAAFDNVAVTSYECSLDGGVSWTNVGIALAANASARTPGGTDQVRVRAKDAAGNVSTPALSTSVNLPLPPDTTAPTLAGGITVSALATTSYTLAWPAGADNIAVTSYERSLDGGTTWTDVGNVLSVNVGGRTPATTDQVRVRAKDAAGNVSVALSASVNLPAAGGGANGTIVTPPLKNNTGTLLSNLTGVTVNVYDQNTGALIVRKTGLSSSSAGVVTISDAAILVGMAYAYEVVTASNGRRLPTGSAA